MSAANRLDDALPGAPRKWLVRQVRRDIALYGIRPCREQWFAAWQWARNIAHSYEYKLATELVPADLRALLTAGHLALPAPESEAPS